MKRYDFDFDDAVEDLTGEWVRFEDHRAEVARLQAKFDELKTAHDALLDRFAKFIG